MLNKAALDKVMTGTRDERVYLCSKEFSLFFCYYFVDYIKYPFAPFHFEMFSDLKKLLAGEWREIAWLMFRESAKTSIAKAFVVYVICYELRNYLNVDSFDKENAERILFDVVLELQTNPRLKEDFGEMFNAKKNPDEIQQKRVSNFVTNNRIRVEAHSTQESVRGRLHGHQRPDLLLLDDFENNKTKDSKAYTAQVISHIDEFKSGLDSKAIVIYLGNYITDYGSIQTLKDRAKTDNRLHIRQVNILDGEGKPTWPSKYEVSDADAKLSGKVSIEDMIRKLGSQVFQAEMMNSPIDETKQEFHKKWFKYKTMDEVNAIPCRKFVTIDPAFTKKEGSDYTGVTKNFVDQEDNWYVDAQQHKINSNDVLGMIFTLWGEGFEKIGIEEGHFKEAIEPFFVKECQERRVYPYVVPLKHGGIMKETRIRGLIPRYEQGKIYHIVDRCDDLEFQLLRFPRSPKDDVVDSLQYQNKIAEPYFPQDEQFGLYTSNYA